DEAQRHLGEETAGTLAHDHEVAVDEPLEAAAGGPAARRPDDRLFAVEHLPHRVLDAAEIAARRFGVARLRLELLEVVAGAEGLASAAEHKHRPSRTGRR